MEPAEVAANVIRDDPELQEIALDLRRIGAQFAGMELAPVVRGDPSTNGLSWRCRSIANANLLRGEELLRFAILSINDGGIVAAHILARALDETMAAVVFARRKLGRALEARDLPKLTELMDRITVGSRYMPEKIESFPKAFNVMDMVDETGRFISELDPELKDMRSAFRENYDFVSEFVHPSLGSFTAYQRIVGTTMVFERDVTAQQDAIRSLLVNLRIAAHTVLTECDALAKIPDLPPGWPEPRPTG